MFSVFSANVWGDSLDDIREGCKMTLKGKDAELKQLYREATGDLIENSVDLCYTIALRLIDFYETGKNKPNNIFNYIINRGRDDKYNNPDVFIDKQNCMENYEGNCLFGCTFYFFTHPHYHKMVGALVGDEITFVLGAYKKYQKDPRIAEEIIKDCLNPTNPNVMCFIKRCVGAYGNIQDKIKLSGGVKANISQDEFDFFVNCINYRGNADNLTRYFDIPTNKDEAFKQLIECNVTDEVLPKIFGNIRTAFSDTKWGLGKEVSYSYSTFCNSYNRLINSSDVNQLKKIIYILGTELEAQKKERIFSNGEKIKSLNGVLSITHILQNSEKFKFMDLLKIDRELIKNPKTNQYKALMKSLLKSDVDAAINVLNRVPNADIQKIDGVCSQFVEKIGEKNKRNNGGK